MRAEFALPHHALRASSAPEAVRAARVLAETLLTAAGSATCFRDAQVAAAPVIADTTVPGTEPAPTGTPVTVPVRLGRLSARRGRHGARGDGRRARPLPRARHDRGGSARGPLPGRRPRRAPRRSGRASGPRRIARAPAPSAEMGRCLAHQRLGTGSNRVRNPAPHTRRPRHDPLRARRNRATDNRVPTPRQRARRRRTARRPVARHRRAGKVATRGTPLERARPAGRPAVDPAVLAAATQLVAAADRHDARSFLDTWPSDEWDLRPYLDSLVLVEPRYPRPRPTRPAS